ncbi:hypothetical protein WMY93_022258 [Mugilogobius chulae]|uniref:VWFA domain-containing protein n=1 Tax=Mugilogobius chulae TaxID=88201 RepID=A0AAW0NDI7_9GOBI
MEHLASELVRLTQTSFMMDSYRELVPLLLWIFFTDLSRGYNFDSKNFRIFQGSKDTQFGYTVQQHEAGGKKWFSSVSSEEPLHQELWSAVAAGLWLMGPGGLVLTSSLLSTLGWCPVAAVDSAPGGDSSSDDAAFDQDILKRSEVGRVNQWKLCALLLRRLRTGNYVPVRFVFTCLPSRPPSSPLLSASLPFLRVYHQSSSHVEMFTPEQTNYWFHTENSGTPAADLRLHRDDTLLVGAPFEFTGKKQTGDVFRCPLDFRSYENCTRLNLGKLSLDNVSERKDGMRLGMSLTSNPRDSSFVTCGPLWSHECGSSLYSTGICTRVGRNFRLSHTLTPALQRCETFMDIVIVLDGSNSIYPWYEVQHFLINVLQKFYIGPGQTQVGVVQYGSSVVHEFSLGDYHTVAEVVEAARGIDQRGGEETRTALGISVARREAFKRGGRPGAKKVMIVITDGESHDSPDLQEAVSLSERDNITLYAIAVLGSYNRRGINPEAFLNEIKFIATDPDEQHFFNVTDESALKDIVDALGERIFSLEGYSLGSLSFSHGSQIYVAGAPRFNHTGKVLIFTLKNTGNLTILHSLPGEQIGSYFGSVLLSVDINADGQTDVLLVSAPMFYSQGWEQGKVYVYRVTAKLLFVLQGALEPSGLSHNSRFGSALSDLPDMNGDGFKELVVGAPLEDEHQGAVYVFHGQDKSIQPHFKQRIAASDFSSGLQYFGQSLHGVLDLNSDGLVDLSVGALGPPSSSAAWYSLVLDEKRFPPRAVLDETSRNQPRNLTLTTGGSAVRDWASLCRKLQIMDVQSRWSWNIPKRFKHKLSDKWEEGIYVVVHRAGELPVYKVKPESGDGPSRTLHRDLLLPCSFLTDSDENLPSPEHSPVQRPRTRQQKHLQDLSTDTPAEDEESESLVSVNVSPPTMHFTVERQHQAPVPSADNERALTSDPAAETAEQRSPLSSSTPSVVSSSEKSDSEVEELSEPAENQPVNESNLPEPEEVSVSVDEGPEESNPVEPPNIDLNLPDVTIRRSTRQKYRLPDSNILLARERSYRTAAEKSADRPLQTLGCGERIIDGNWPGVPSQGTESDGELSPETELSPEPEPQPEPKIITVSTQQHSLCGLPHLTNDIVGRIDEIVEAYRSDTSKPSRPATFKSDSVKPLQVFSDDKSIEPRRNLTSRRPLQKYCIRGEL